MGSVPMSRFDASAVLKARVRDRFENQCAACKREGPLVTDVAHLYEDATSQPPRAERLIILCTGCNQAQERAKDRAKPSLLEILDPDKVSIVARCAYRAGSYKRAYAGQRLAAYLFETRRQPSRAVECLTEATSALRPIRWGDFLEATMLEVERLCLSHHVGMIQRWLYLDRLSLVLYDYRRWQESAALQSAAQELASKIGSDERDPQRLEFDRASSFRREALIRASTTQLTRSATRKLIGRLIEDAREFEIHGQFDGYATNLDVAGKLAREIIKDRVEAHKYSQEALAPAAKITHKWVLQEHYWREADFYLATHNRDKTLANVVEALRHFRDHPVVLEPTLGAAGPVAHDPIAELERFGIQEGRLRELGVAPSANPPPELRLGFSKTTAARVARNLLR